MWEPARCSELGRGAGSAGWLSRHSFPLTWGDLGLHSRLCSRSPQHTGLCEMSSWPRWVAWGQGPFPSNGEPQLQHLGQFRAHLSTLDRDASCCHTGCSMQRTFSVQYGFYWIMTWNLCREKALCTQWENGKKTLVRMQILRRGKASSACFPQQRWALLSFWLIQQWRDFLDALLEPSGSFRQD